MTFKSSIIVGAAIFAGCAAAVANAADSIAFENVHNISATVDSVDVNNRLLAIRGPGGRSMMIEVPTEVRDLKQIKAGDKVRIGYREAIVATIQAKGTGRPPNSASRDSSGSGSKSVVTSGRKFSTTVTIQSVDKSSGAVAFKDSDGFSRNTTVTNPDMKKFVATLKTGDQVEMAYSEALAVSVEVEK